RRAAVVRAAADHAAGRAGRAAERRDPPAARRVPRRARARRARARRPGRRAGPGRGRARRAGADDRGPRPRRHREVRPLPAGGRPGPRTGWTVAATSGRGVVEPYAPLGELVGQLAGDGDGLLDGLGDTPRAALRAVSGTAAPPAGLTRHQVIGALRRLLRAAAAGGPGALVVLDDAHEADEATVDALAHLPVAGPRAVALVVAYRPERAAEPLQAAAARLARAGATTIDLPPLADHDAAALVAAAAEARPSAEAVAEVVRLAEGNPFFLRELATALGRDGGAPAQPS